MLGRAGLGTGVVGFRDQHGTHKESTGGLDSRCLRELEGQHSCGEAEADQTGPKDPSEEAPGPLLPLAPLTTLEYSFDIQPFTQEQIWLPLQSLQGVELVSPAPASCKDHPHPPTHLPPQGPTARTTGRSCQNQLPSHLWVTQTIPEFCRPGEEQPRNAMYMYVYMNAQVYMRECRQLGSQVTS